MSNRNSAITIIGAGNNGLTMAAHLASEGHDVKIWNRSIETIQKIIETKTIKCNGLLNGEFKIRLATNNMKEALQNADLVFITQPAHTHNYLAGLMSEYLTNEMSIILSPGRTFGAFGFKNSLVQNGVVQIPTITETQTIIYTCRKIAEDKVTLLELKNNVLLSGFNPQKNKSFIEQLPASIARHLKPAKSLIETSLGNVGMILHCAPVLLNTGWIENKETSFLYYYSGITPSIANFLEKLDEERISVAVKLGHKIESVVDWFANCYNTRQDNLYDCIQAVQSYKTIDAPASLDHRYIFEDVATGLVPLEVLGKHLGLEMKITQLVIDLSTELLSYDFRKHGRNLQGYINEIIDTLKV